MGQCIYGLGAMRLGSVGRQENAIDNVLDAIHVEKTTRDKSYMNNLQFNTYSTTTLRIRHIKMS